MTTLKWISTSFPLYILVILIVSACNVMTEIPGGASPSETQSSEATITRAWNQTDTATPTKPTSTQQPIPSAQQVVQTPIPSLSPSVAPTPLPTVTNAPSGWRSYILFERHGDSWIASPDGSDIRMIADGYIPVAWSPSGASLLLYREGGLYVAEADGSDPQLVYQGDRVDFAWWLTDEWVLVEVRPSVIESYVSYLNVGTGEIHTDQPDYFRIIEAASPTGEFWFQRTDIGLEIADLTGMRTIVDIPGPGGSQQTMLYPDLVFSPFGDAIIHLGCLGNPINPDTCYLYRSRIQGFSVVGSDILLERDSILSSGFQMSPDGRYAAIIYDFYPQPMIKFLNLQTLTIDYEWDYPGPPAQPFFLWSPDSTQVAVVYNNLTEGRVHGIVLVDMLTGDSSILTDGTVDDFLKDWRYVDIGS